MENRLPNSEARKNNRCEGNYSLTWKQVMEFTEQRALFSDKRSVVRRNCEITEPNFQGQSDLVSLGPKLLVVV